MKVSVVVPAFNEERLLPDSLRSIRSAMEVFAQMEWRTELIVCDNNSTDRTAEIARAAGAQVVFEPVNQISRARNAGARPASGDWLVFVDADSTPSRELFSAVAQEIRGGLTLAGGSTVLYEHAGRAAACAIAAWNLVSRAMKWAAGSFIFCDATAFRQVRGFSEALYASEEIDLFVRLKRLARRRGKKIAILERHPLRTSDRKLHLYSMWSLAGFAAKTIVTRGRTLHSRTDCHAWYDGRR
jgi:glycosyltransferase involved in cell wall biosynthesis